MVEAVGCAIASEFNCVRTDFALHEVSPFDPIQSGQSQLLVDYMQRAIALAVNEPKTEDSMRPARAALTADAGNTVADKKSLLLSSVDRAGAGLPSAVGVNQEQKTSLNSQPMEEMTMQIRHLYREVTKFSVAWSVCQQVQKDVNHLMKAQ